MPKHLALLFIATLALGVLTGAYVRFMTRAPHMVEISEPPSPAVEVVATEYGGCERLGCAAYRLTDTGEYTYMRYNTRDGGTRYLGTLGSEERSRFLSLFQKTSLSELQESMFTGTCPITYDGIAYRYEIKAKGASYDLDSCRENLSNNAFISELQSLFTTLGRAHADE